MFVLVFKKPVPSFNLFVSWPCPFLNIYSLDLLETYLGHIAFPERKNSGIKKLYSVYSVPLCH